jgi:hypothetical protein
VRKKNRAAVGLNPDFGAPISIVAECQRCGKILDNREDFTKFVEENT